MKHYEAFAKGGCGAIFMIDFFYLWPASPAINKTNQWWWWRRVRYCALTKNLYYYIHMHETTLKIQEKVRQFLENHGLFDKEKSLLVGFSGGSDSLCLLDVLYRLGLNPIAAHLNHNWRPKESKQEQEHAKNYCEERKIDFYTETLPPDLPQTEEEARYQRYRFFNEIAQKTGSKAIFTGHTATDNTETILYRIIKGTGITGLKGIPEKREQNDGPAVYRPLLEFSREDCIKYCEENDLKFSIDSSNYNQKYARNRIRLSLLPELRTYNPEVDAALLRLSQIAAEADQIIAEYADKTGVLNDVINTQDYLKQSEPLQKRVLADYLAKNNIEHSFENIHDLFKFIQENKNSTSGKTFSIGKDLWFFVSKKEMKLIDKKPPEKLPELKIEKYTEKTPEFFPEETANYVYADLSNIKGPLSVRTRLPGDIIQPFGMQHKTKLKKYLINHGIPQHERDSLPLAVDAEGEVLWVFGVGISELLRAKDTPTHIITLE